VQIAPGSRLQFAINAITAIGGSVAEWDAEQMQLTGVLDGVPVVLDLNHESFSQDENAARHYIQTRLRFPNTAQSKWSGLLAHAVLVRRQYGQSQLGQVQDVRVENISPSGKYVRFLNLQTNQHFWSEVDDYALLEDLGVRVTNHPLKPVAPPKREMVQTPIN
jgi:hypothetical protein